MSINGDIDIDYGLAWDELKSGLGDPGGASH